MQQLRDAGVVLRRALDEAELVVDGTHQASEGVVDALARGHALVLDLLAVHVEGAVGHRREHLGLRLFLEVRGLLLPVLDDLPLVGAEGSVVLLLDVGVDLGGAVQPVPIGSVLGEHQDGLAAGVEEQLPAGHGLGDGAAHLKQQATGVALHTDAVHALLHREGVHAHGDLGVLEDPVEEGVADGVDHGAVVGLLARYLTGDLLLVVGEEPVSVAHAAHVVLLDQAVQGLGHGGTQSHTVLVNGRRHHHHEVLKVGGYVVHVEHQIQELEHLHVPGLQALPYPGGLIGAVDHLADMALHEGGQGVVEAPERHEHALVLGLDGLGRLLEAADHGALTAGEVLARAAVLADLAHGPLGDAELVAGERERARELVGRAESLEVGRGVLEGEEVCQNGGVLGVLGLEHLPGAGRLLQDAALDDLVHTGAGERETGVKAPLDLGEVVARHLGDLVDGLLAGDHHPHEAAALDAQGLHDGLEAEHEVGVVADELPHLVDHEHQAEGTAQLALAALGVGTDLCGEGVNGTHLVRRAAHVHAVGKPILGLAAGHDAGVGKGVNDVLLVELVVGAGVHPGLAGHLLERSAESLCLALLLDVGLQARQRGVLAVETAVVREDAGEGAGDGTGVPPACPRC